MKTCNLDGLVVLLGMKYKDFFIDDESYHIDADKVSKEEFEERRYRECWHRWTQAPEKVGVSEDSYCRDCMMTSKGSDYGV
jgi:hypothetical protein